MRIAVLEIVTGLLLAFTAGIFMFLSIQFPEAMNTRDVGPAAFPFIISVLTILFSAMLVTVGYLRIKQGDQEKVVTKRSQRIMGAILFSVVYAFLMPRLGYYFTTAFYIFFMLRMAGEQKWKTLIIVTIFFEIFAKLGFEILLNVPLP